MKKLHDIIKERILILDGAMGTMIQTYGLTEEDFWNESLRSFCALKRVQMKGNNDVLCLTRPDVVTDIHRRYLRAGADIIETNTFSSQRISQADYHMQDYAREMALQGACLARQCADEFSSSDKPRFVAGSIGPTNKTCSMSPDVSNPARRDLTYCQLFEAYLEQMDALIEGGVDALLIETIFDSLNSKCAIDAAMTAMQQRGVTLPIMLSVTVSDLAGRTLSGQTLEAYLASVSTYPIFSIGLNCSFGARQMKPFLKELARRAPYYISCYPNAGLPNSMGLYDETAETMAPQIGELVDEGLVNIIGGCCGTTDEFIQRYAPLVREGMSVDGGERIALSWKKPHVPAEKSQAMWLSGLELLEIGTPEYSPSTTIHLPPVTHYDMRFLKPLDEDILHEVGKNFKKMITVEDGVRNGGLGSAVTEWFQDHDYDVKVKRLGLPDCFVEQGTVAELHHIVGIDEESIAKTCASL